MARRKGKTGREASVAETSPGHRDALNRHAGVAGVLERDVLGAFCLQIEISEVDGCGSNDEICEGLLSGACQGQGHDSVGSVAADVQRR